MTFSTLDEIEEDLERAQNAEDGSPNDTLFAIARALCSIARTLERTTESPEAAAAVIAAEMAAAEEKSELAPGGKCCRWNKVGTPSSDDLGRWCGTHGLPFIHCSSTDRGKCRWDSGSADAGRWCRTHALPFDRCSAGL